VKIYIAGQITGLKSYKENFHKAEKYLNARGHICMNPSILPEGFPYETYLPICVTMINACEGIYMLKNWEDSRGAKVEHEYAKAQGKTIIYE